MKKTISPVDKFYHLIRCTNCNVKQVAAVDKTPVFATYVHTCTACGYVIMESEWETLPPIGPSLENNIVPPSPPLVRGPFTEQVPVEYDLRALTWKQPYAQLMLHDKIETRTRATNVRGWVLICAGLNPYSAFEVAQISGKSFGNVAAKVNTGFGINLGKAIAVGKLVKCSPMVQDDELKTFVEYSPGRFCWHFINVHAIEPFDFKGSQGWTFVNDYETRKKIVIL